MARSFHESSGFIGLVIARSVDVPSPPDDISYTIQIEDDTGVHVLEDIVPQAYFRDYPVEVDLVPFEVGMYLPMGISRQGATETINIMAGERLDVGECGDG